MVDPGGLKSAPPAPTRWLREWYPLAIFVGAMLTACVFPWAIASYAGVAVRSGVQRVFESKAKITSSSATRPNERTTPPTAQVVTDEANTSSSCKPCCARQPGSPIRKHIFLGFVEGNSNYVYFAALFFLWLHACSIKPQTKDEPSHWKWWTVPAAIVVCAVWMGHNAARTFFLTGEERVIVSYVNADISGWSWCYQLLLSLLMCCPVVVSWQASRISRLHVSEKVSGWATQARTLGLQIEDATGADSSHPKQSKWLTGELLYKLQDHAVYVGRLFDSWQAHSLLLAGAFLPWTAYYWSTGRSFNDHRYYWSTLTVHLLWGFTWFFQSAPIFIASRRFNLHRSAVVAALVVAESKSAEYAQKTAPISTVRLALVGLASVVTFAAPLLGLK